MSDGDRGEGGLKSSSGVEVGRGKGCRGRRGERAAWRGHRAGYIPSIGAFPGSFHLRNRYVALIAKQSASHLLEIGEMPLLSAQCCSCCRLLQGPTTPSRETERERERKSSRSSKWQ